MAELVLGVGTSHGPQLGIPPEKWQLLREKDENDKRMNFQELARRARPGIKDEICEEVWNKKYNRCRTALMKLRQILSETAPDILVVVGDDQHENLLDDNMPVFCVYRGPAVSAVRRQTASLPLWAQVEDKTRALPLEYYTCDPALAEHLIHYLNSQGFDVACSNKLRPDIGLGHAFRNVYDQIMPEGRFPIVPLMVNTFFPPNQPSPRRCHALGESLAKAINAWNADRTVAIVASGGLSHVIIDEELDKVTLDALQGGDKEALCALPVEKLVHGNSEIRNWIVMAGAVQGRKMSLVDYVPCYRSVAGTGCAMAFAYWT